MKNSFLFRPLSFVLPAAVGLLFLLAAPLTWASVDLYQFYALANQDSITLVWDTAQELDNLGFNLWRDDTNSVSDCHSALRINAGLIPSQAGGQATGAHYEYGDANVEAAVTYRYWVESVDTSGMGECHPPIEASLDSGGAISTPVPGGGATEIPTSTLAPASTATNAPASSPTTTLPAGGRATNTPAAPTFTPIAPQQPGPPTTTPAGLANTNLPPTPTTASDGNDDGQATSPAEVGSTALPPAVGGEVRPAEATPVAAVASSDAPPTPTPPAAQVIGQNPFTGDSSADSGADSQPTGLLGGRFSVLSILILLAGAALTLLGGIVAAWLYLTQRKRQ